MDFMFLGPKDSPGDTVPCLMREVVSNMVMAAVVPRKTTGLCAAKRALAFLSEVGCLHGDLIVRSDQEPTISSLVNEVGRLRGAAGGGRFIVEASPMGSSGSSGRVERARTGPGQSHEGGLSGPLESGRVAPPCRLPWTLEYAAHLLNPYEGRDGRTAYERLKAKKAKFLGYGVRRNGSMANPPNRRRCSWKAGLGVGPRCFSRSQGEDGGDRDRGEIQNLQSEDRQEEVDRGSLEPGGHGAGHRRTMEDEQGRRQGRRGSSRSCRYPRKQSASMMRMSKGERWPTSRCQEAFSSP